MTPKEGNKLIAKFNKEGYYQVWRKGGYKPYWADHFENEEEAKIRIDAFDDENYRKFGERVAMIEKEVEVVFIAPEYHKDWNKLMPVVEKIEKMGCIFEMHISLAAGSNIFNSKVKFPSEKNSAIEAVYDSVVQFIQWYNKNSSK